MKGPGGTLEKQITLDLAKRLKSVLEARMGVHVVLTRDDDRAVTLDERTATANNAKGHVFVSLHMNGSPSPARTGPAVFFMRLDREGEDTRREAGAQAQALPVLGGGTRVIETIRWDLAQVRHLEASQRLATLLAGALDRPWRRRAAAGPARAAPGAGGARHARGAVRDGVSHQCRAGEGGRGGRPARHPGAGDLRRREPIRH